MKNNKNYQQLEERELSCIDMNETKGLSIKFNYICVTIPILVKFDNRIKQEKFVLKKVNDLCNFFGVEIKEVKESNHGIFCGKSWSIGEHILVRAFGVFKKKAYNVMQLELKGSAFMQIELGKNISYFKIFDYLVNKCKGKIRRIDIAVDDKLGDIITQEEIKFHLERNYYSTNFITKPIFIGNDTNGVMIQLGSNISTSTSKLVIYDLKAQQKNKDEQYDGDYYMRYEMRFYESTAEYLFLYLLEKKFDNIGELSSSLLLDMLNIKEVHNPEERYKSKVKTLPQWNNFLGEVKKLRLFVNNDSKLKN